MNLSDLSSLLQERNVSICILFDCHSVIFFHYFLCGIFPNVYNSSSGRPARFLCEGVFLNTPGHIHVAKAIFVKRLPFFRLLAKGRMLGTSWVCNAILTIQRTEKNVQNPYCERSNELITATYKGEQ